MIIRNQNTRRLYALTTSVLLLGCGSMQGAVFQIDLSPASGALNAGLNPYTQDHAVGLSGLNTSGQYAVAGSGNEIGTGISFDNVTKLLSFDFAYGAAFGFTDLVGDYTVMHIHGPGLVNYPAVNTNAGVQVNLGSFHTASGARAGRVSGSLSLSAPQETQLFDNSLYINIHSTVYPGGEIRAQLIAVPEPSTYALLSGIAILGFVGYRRRSRM